MPDPTPEVQYVTLYENGEQRLVPADELNLYEPFPTEKEEE